MNILTYVLAAKPRILTTGGALDVLKKCANAHAQIKHEVTVDYWVDRKDGTIEGYINVVDIPNEIGTLAYTITEQVGTSCDD